MRIITGKYKGRNIKTPKGIRPTEDRVRKAFFDIMGDISDLSFLELFAGSGAMGLEALSLGAQGVMFVENDRNCVKVIEDNLKTLSSQSSVTSPPKIEIIAKDVLKTIPWLREQGQKFNLIFLDPPYYQGLAEKTLQILQDYDILLPSGYIGIQHFKKDTLADKQDKLVLFKRKEYGDSILSFYIANLRTTF
jgi:16S rRNA (guanine(966)-N(2))-methyltransferase RsmD